MIFASLLYYSLSLFLNLLKLASLKLNENIRLFAKELFLKDLDLMEDILMKFGQYIVRLAICLYCMDLLFLTAEILRLRHSYPCLYSYILDICRFDLSL